MTQSQEAFYLSGLNHSPFSAETQNTHPHCNLQFLKCSSKADMEQVVNHLVGNNLCDIGHRSIPKPSPFSLCDTCKSYPGDFSDGVFCDLLVNAKASTTLEKGNGFPKVSLRHPHQRRYTLDEHKHQKDYMMLQTCRGLPLKPPQQFQNKGLCLIDLPQLILLLLS